MTWSKKKKVAVAGAGAAGLVLAAVAGARGSPPAPQGPVYTSLLLTVLPPELASVVDVNPPAYQSYLPEGNITDPWTISVRADSIGDPSRNFVFHGELYDGSGALVGTMDVPWREADAQQFIGQVVNVDVPWNLSVAALSGPYSVRFFSYTCDIGVVAPDPQCKSAGPEFDKSWTALSYGKYCAFQTFQVPCYDTVFLVTDLAGNPVPDAQVNAVCDANPGVCNLLAPTGIDGKATLSLPFYGVDVATNYFTVTVTAVFSGQLWQNTVQVYVPRDGVSFVIPVGPPTVAPPTPSTANITAFNPADSTSRYWEVWFDKSPGSYIGGGNFSTPADIKEVHSSGGTMTFNLATFIGPGQHFMYFTVASGVALGGYSGTITLDGAPADPFSGANIQTFVRIDFILNSDGSVTLLGP